MYKNSYNKVVLVGHLGGDPEGRYTKTGRSTSVFSVATNESWKQQDGSFVEHTEWHHVVAWDKLADFSNDYLHKGQLVTIEGYLRTRVWEKKSGDKQTKTEVICTSVIPLEWKQKNNKSD